MKICKEVLNDILNSMPIIPPEAGGIIGGKKGKINIWEFDLGYKEEGCMYCPNVESLNNTIEIWINEGFDFMGIFHVHFGGAKTLSEGDKKYIQEIMNAMPDAIKKLYFPIIVQPEKELCSYKAVRNLWGEIKIKPDKVKII